MSQTTVPIPLKHQPTDFLQILASQGLTFAEYLQYQGEPGVLYELYRGRLIEMPTATFLHAEICGFIVYKLQQYFASANINLVVRTGIGVRTDVDVSRIPDVTVCSQSLWEQLLLRTGAGVLDTQANELPQLVIEVVSDDARRDYIIKRAEYAMIRIPEYVILDPHKDRVWLLTNPESEDVYDRLEFKRGQEFRSVQFPDLVLSVDEILSPPVVENLIKQEKQDFLWQLDRERQRAERLAAKLREMNIDPDSV